jgi:nucleotide-binding universal stress UspA family protein
MSYNTILVCLDLHRSNANLMKASAGLANKLGAKAVGIAVSQPLLLYAENVYVPADVFDEHQRNTEAQMKVLETSFSQAMQQQQADFSWHSKITMEPHAKYIADYSRSADLLVTSIRESNSTEQGNETTSDTAGELVIQSGKPVLLIPNDIETLYLDCALVCWRDTREARRAISDAIPLLQQCKKVHLLELYSKEQAELSKRNLTQTAAWLATHGIYAICDSIETSGNESEQLQAYANQHDVDILIGGAFGHSRLREWMFGGVTRNLFFHGAQCALISH